MIQNFEMLKLDVFCKNIKQSHNQNQPDFARVWRGQCHSRPDSPNFHENLEDSRNIIQ